MKFGVMEDIVETEGEKNDYQSEYSVNFVNTDDQPNTPSISDGSLNV